MAPRWPIGIPTRLRPIAVLSEGRGTTVWQARDTATGVDRAVKVVCAVPGSTVDPARRAETEARALARLGGVAGVVRLHELGRTDRGDAWLAYDLVTGGTLAASAPLPVERVRKLGVTLASTLAEAHGRDVHHGDLSPTNVILGDGGAPLLADFGMAGLGYAPDDPGGLTPAYAAPERLRGAPPSGPSDVWSLAATLDAVTVERPGGDLRELLDRCRSRDPAARPSASEVADGLARPGDR